MAQILFRLTFQRHNLSSICHITLKKIGYFIYSLDLLQIYANNTIVQILQCVAISGHSVTFYKKSIKGFHSGHCNC
jgi:hypothetical protein